MPSSIQAPAVAGTLESSDCQVSVEQGSDTLELSIESSVMNQYGKQIKACALETLERLGIKAGKVTIVDHGALDCTLKARIETAILRSTGTSSKDVDWGGMIR